MLPSPGKLAQLEQLHGQPELLLWQLKLQLGQLDQLLWQLGEQLLSFCLWIDGLVHVVVHYDYVVDKEETDLVVDDALVEDHRTDQCVNSILKFWNAITDDKAEMSLAGIPGPKADDLIKLGVEVLPLGN